MGGIDLSILERLRDPSILETMTTGEKLWGAVIVAIIGMVVCMVALTAIMYAIKLMHALMNRKSAAAEAPAAEKPAAPAALPVVPDGKLGVLSPAEGTVSARNAAEGAAVREGDVLLLLNVGGSEYEIPAPADGIVSKIPVQPGDAVAVNALLAVLQEKEG